MRIAATFVCFLISWGLAMGAHAEEPVDVRHWSHVILHVADVETSLAFYQGYLGARIFSDDEVGGADFEEMVGVPGAKARIVNLVLGGQKVELIGLVGVPSGPPAERVARGLAGFAIRVEDVATAYARAQAMKLTTGGPPTEIHGFRQFMVVDPDGVHVEISQPPDGLEKFGPFSGR